jgi:hypothetical protein
MGTAVSTNLRTDSFPAHYNRVEIPYTLLKPTSTKCFVLKAEQATTLHGFLSHNRFINHVIKPISAANVCKNAAIGFSNAANVISIAATVNLRAATEIIKGAAEISKAATKITKGAFKIIKAASEIIIAAIGDTSAAIKGMIAAIEYKSKAIEYSIQRNILAKMQYRNGVLTKISAVWLI